MPSNRSRFWLIFKDGEVDLRLRDPGFDVDLIVAVHIKTMTQIWLGHTPLDQALRSEDLKLEGDRKHVEYFRRLFCISLLAVDEA